MASEPQFQSTGGRRSDRHSFSAEVQFRAGNRRANVRVQDISKFGARIEGVFLVHEGDHFFVKLTGMESIEARVAWVEDFQFGCEFEKPLNDAVLDALLRQN
ncbi:MAG TPA: PilZ domain-containing protein [Novosphingobium sp.]|nr:PilZ domain-containing protein [Novosphingobium sp.]